MKKIVIALMVIAILSTMLLPTFASTYVRGYYRSNGTYVQPHYRSSPNNSVYDNWSTKGNVNPYTSSYGTKNPYSSYNYTPSYNYYDYTPSYNYNYPSYNYSYPTYNYSW